MRLAHLGRLVLVPVSLSVASTPLLAQGDNGFLRGQGKLDLSLTYTNDSYDHFWVGNDKVSDPAVGTVTRETTALYAAYGLRDDIDLVFNAAYVGADSDGTGGFPTEEDLQDATFGVKWAFWKRRMGPGETSVLFAPSIKQPMTNYEDNNVTAIGDGQTDLRARMIGQYTWDNGLFAAIESGYDRRNGAPHDEIPLNITLGGTIAQRFTIMPFYQLVDELGGIDINQIPADGGFPATEEDYQRLGVAAYVRITDQFGISGRYMSTLDGKNTGDVDSYSVGLTFRVL